MTLLTLPDHLNSSTVFSGARCVQSLVFYIVFYRSVFRLAIVLSVLLRFAVHITLLVLCSCLYGLVSFCNSCLRLYFVQICLMFYMSL